MTLVEVLVAMVILLVGVWAVARGFPTLMRNIATEQERTQAARLVEQRIETLKQAPACLPLAIIGLPANAANIDPESFPRDPDSTNNPINSRDDVVWVIGERAKVPAPDAPNHYPLLTVSQGLIEEDPGSVSVWVVEKLEPLPYPPPGGSAPAGYFYLDRNGNITVPGGYDGVLADYVWVDSSGQTHWVHEERVMGAGGSLAVAPAAAGGFAGTLAGPAHVEGLRALTVLPLGNTTPAPDEVAIAPFGLGLVFNSALSGSTVLVDYKLRTRANDKRDLYMIEDHVLGESVCRPDPNDPAFRFASVQLAWGGLEPRLSSVFPNISGTFAVVAVDLVSGEAYWEGNGVSSLDPNEAARGSVELHI
ncbi:MAG: type II secretion system protein, partial [Armatimonadetes bacterium]|nr:type II secretion system protein [Armatimonadota bacterium]